MSYSIELEMTHLCCFECGIQYAAPYQWAKTRSDHDRDDDDRAIVCPNGHKNRYAFPEDESDKRKDMKEENEDLKRQLAQAIHDHDQAEARLRDELSQNGKSSNLENDDAREVMALKPAPGGRVFCPHCDNHYKALGSLRTHLRDVHADSATADNLARLVAAMEGGR